MKLCKDCKHFASPDDLPTCRVRGSWPDYVMGGVVWIETNPYEQRRGHQLDGYCGPNGEWWEAK